MPAAEDVYFFKHAMLREAAYGLFLPEDRAQLHGHALHALEAHFGGRPEHLPIAQRIRLPAHSTDAVALELAQHARLAEDPALVLYTIRAAQHAEIHDRPTEAATLWTRCIDLLAGADRAEAMRRAASATHIAGHPAQAEALYARAMEEARAHGAATVEANALMGLSGVQRNTGRREEALAGFARALQLHQAAGEHYFATAALGNIALIYQDIGRTAEAEETYKQVLEAHRRLGNRRAEGIATGHLAGLYQETGRAAEAEAMTHAAIAIHREVNDRRFEGIALANLATLEMQRGNHEQAEELFRQALALHASVGNRRSTGIALGNLATLYQATGRPAQALATCEQALAIHRELGNRSSEGEALGVLGDLLAAQGRTKEAEAACFQGLVACKATGNRRGAGMILAGIGRLLEPLDPARAQGAFHESCLEFEAIGDKRLLGATLCAMGLCMLGRGDDRARATWTRGAGLLRETGDASELQLVTAAMQAACAKAQVPPLDQPGHQP